MLVHRRAPLLGKSAANAVDERISRHEFALFVADKSSVALASFIDEEKSFFKKLSQDSTLFLISSVFH